ncbi:MAG: hypothetical protein ABIR37_03735 [Candidatus Saccharimonadales bacterium]
MINQNNLSFEKNTPKNDIDGVLQAYLFATHAAVAGTARVLWPIVEAENRRQTHEREMKPTNPAPEVASAPIRPTATEMLAQVATNPREQQTVVDVQNILAESTDTETMATQQRNAIDAIHAEIEAERLNQGDFDRAA